MKRYYLGSLELRNLINGSPVFSQKALAEHLGMTTQQVNNILTGKTGRPYNRTLKGFAEYLGRSLDRDDKGIFWEERKDKAEQAVDELYLSAMERSLVKMFRKLGADERSFAIEMLRFYVERNR